MNAETPQEINYKLPRKAPQTKNNVHFSRCRMLQSVFGNDMKSMTTIVDRVCCIDKAAFEHRMHTTKIDTTWQKKYGSHSRTNTSYLKALYTSRYVFRYLKIYTSVMGLWSHSMYLLLGCYLDSRGHATSPKVPFRIIKCTGTTILTEN